MLACEHGVNHRRNNIAHRLSPIQKSQLVRMVKDSDKANLTAAIGDGGNDVSMIQEASLGLGIIGVEGDAAAKAADFSFAKVSDSLLCGGRLRSCPLISVSLPSKSTLRARTVVLQPALNSSSGTWSGTHVVLG